MGVGLPHSVRVTEVFLTLLLVGLGGCTLSSVTPYPQDWPAQVERADVCISPGEYRNTGELRMLSAPKWRYAKLTSVLLNGDPDASVAPNDDGTVRLRMKEDTLVVWTAVRDADQSKEFRSVTARATCAASGVLSMNVKSVFQSEPSLMKRVSFISIWNAIDGSLIVRLELSSESTSFPPTPKQEELMWCRFERVN